MAGRRRPELGQHYLRPSVARRLVDLSAVGAQDFVIEIGPGRGALTDPLAERVGRLLALEVDPMLAARLAERYRARDHVEVVEADVLAYRWPRGHFSVVSNIPYGATAEIMRRLLAAAPREAWLVVQREAAVRYAGRPWGLETVQSLRLKAAWHVEVRGYPRRVDFDPPPAVESAVLHLARRDRPLADAGFPRFIEGVFGRAETVGRCLRPYVTHTQLRRLSTGLGFAPSARPTTLTFDQWLAVYRFACGGLL
ncbi:MAG: rRNA adenine dimethyltransferase family protein [Dehalococcoidia bacterium]